MENWLQDREFEYDPMKHGAVVAIRIYFAENTATPLADLKFAYSSEKYPKGAVETICWVQPHHREAFVSGINGYTYIFDEREKKSFSEW